MYTEYWGMECLPFENAPDSRFFYESAGHREAVTRLVFSIQTHKAIALITGDFGSGKTLMCQTVISMLSPSEVRTAFITNPRMSSLDITREIAYQLGEEILSESKYDVIHGLNSLLDRHAAAGRHCAAIIDEAQLLIDNSVLEDLRLLLNHQSGGRFLLTLVLVGQTELREILRSIPQMKQRIGLKYHIPHLSKEEIPSYIEHRLKTAQGNIDIFEQDAVDEIIKLSNGNPREINALCDLSLLTASLAGNKQVTLGDIQDAGNERA